MSVSRKTFSLIAVATVLTLVFGGACDKPYEGGHHANQPPETYLSSGPPEGETNTSYRVPFHWNGYDPDGAIDHFEFIMTNDWETGSLVIDETTSDVLESLGYEWVSVEVHDTLLVVEASQAPSDTIPEDEEYFYGEDLFLFIGQHTFFLRAVDEYGLADPIPAHRSFTATTIAPSVQIDEPDLIVDSWQDVPTDIFFGWTGKDSIGDGTVIDPDSTRFAIIPKGDYGISEQTHGSILADLPDSIWSRWRGWDEPEDSLLLVSGKGTLVPGLTPHGEGGADGRYIFFAQAKDEAGAITSHYDNGVNMRKLRAVKAIFPSLVVSESSLGVFTAEGDFSRSFTIGEGQTLDFNWFAMANYGSKINGYRSGWDILDPSNDEEWSSWDAGNTSITGVFSSGTHELYIQCRDYSNNRTTMILRFFVVPFSMERDLLLIDDYNNWGVEDYGYPVEDTQVSWSTSFAHHDTEVDLFWIDQMLSDYSGFEASRDTVGVSVIQQKPPFEVMANYKHIIWETRRGGGEDTGLYRIAHFFDPNSTNSQPYNYVTAYMDEGGQILFCGSQTLQQFMPHFTDVAYASYPNMTKLPTAYRRHFRFTQGDIMESLENFIPYSQFGVDVLCPPVNPFPRPYGTNADQANAPPIAPDEFKTYRNYWAMTSATSTGLEVEYGFPNTYPLPDTLKMREEVEDWFTWVKDNWEDSNGHFGLFDIEIYNWEHLADSLNRHGIPPEIAFREELYVHLLSYVPSDSTCRFGTAPDFQHETGNNELKFTSARELPSGETVYYPEHGHMIAMIGLKNPESPNVVLGMHPYFFRNDHAKQLVDHILVDIFDLQK